MGRPVIVITSVCGEPGAIIRVVAVCRQSWKRMTAAEIKRLRELEEENAKLKRMYADIRAEGEAVGYLKTEREMSERWACSPELTSIPVAEWGELHDIELDFIEPGRQMQNGFIERFNRTYRQAVLDMYIFESLEEVRRLTADGSISTTPAVPMTPSEANLQDLMT